MNKIITHIDKLDNRYADCFLVYTRKSTDDADNQKNSIEYQVKESERECEVKELPIAAVSIDGFCEDGIIKEHHSGFKSDSEFVSNPDGSISFKVERPKFLLLVNLLRQKKFKGVICLCWDRISRNEADDLLIKKLLEQGINIRFVQATYDATSSGALHMDIDGMFSRHYSRTISEKVRNTNKKLRAEGKCIYRPPLGYLSEGSGSKPLDPQTAPLVKRLFELYATGEWSFSTLAQWANRNGMTKKPCRRNRTLQERSRGVQVADIPKTVRPITEKTIWHILNNPFYIGKLTHKDELLDSTAHQPLIDLATFYKVQATLKMKTVKVEYPELAFFTYRGLVKCGVCKRAYSPYVQKGIVYYRSACVDNCANNVKNINDAFITKNIQKILNRVHFSESEILRMEVNAFKALDSLNERRNKQLEDLRLQFNKTKENLNYLANDKLNLLRTGVFTHMQIIEEEGRLKALLKEIEEKMSAFTTSAQSMLEYIISFSELAKNAAIYYPFALDTEKRDLVIQVFSELYIDNGELKYEAKEGYNALLQRFNTKTRTLGGQNTIVLELEQIYEFVRNSKSFLEKYLNRVTNNKSPF